MSHHEPLTWFLTALAVLLVVGWYLSYSAARLDRLHHRVESARAALDAHLVRRAAAALEVAQVLDPAAGLLVTDAATRALTAGEQGDTAAVEEAESDLTRALTLALDDAEPFAAGPSGADLPGAEPPGADPWTRGALEALAEANSRVQLARRFHNDAVAHAQRVRRKRVVRWARLAGHAELPQMIEIDDSPPPGLSG